MRLWSGHPGLTGTLPRSNVMPGLFSIRCHAWRLCLAPNSSVDMSWNFGCFTDPGTPAWCSRCLMPETNNAKIGTLNFRNTFMAGNAFLENPTVLAAASAAVDGTAADSPALPLSFLPLPSPFLSPLRSFDLWFSTHVREPTSALRRHVTYMECLPFLVCLSLFLLWLCTLPRLPPFWSTISMAFSVGRSETADACPSCPVSGSHSQHHVAVHGAPQICWSTSARRLGACSSSLTRGPCP